MLGTIAVFYFAYREAKNRGITYNSIFKFQLWEFFGGLFGARLFYIIFFIDKSLTESVFFFFNITKSGLSSFGAVVGVILTAVLYRYLHKVNIWRLLDIASIGFMLGLAIGRIGCYCAGCCYGKTIVHNVPWAVYYKDALRHPAQVYDLFNALFVFGVIQKVKNFRLFDGALFLINICLYSFIRMFVEFFRESSRIGLFTSNQYLYFAAFLVCSTIFIKKWKIKAV